MEAQQPITLEQIRNLFNEQIRAILNEELKPVNDKLATIELQQKIMMAKMSNSLKGKNEPLEKVPIVGANGKERPVDGVEYPTIAMLIVAGNERIPGTEMTNNWNAKKSLKLIREYDPGYATDEETEVISAKRRLKVAQCLGVSPSQINLAATTYYY
jgi:hypothetical protein